MQQQYAGAVAVQLHALKDRTVSFRMDRMPVMHADKLHPIDFHFLIVQNPHTRAQQRRKVFGVAIELFMIAGDIVQAERRLVWHSCPRLCGRRRLRCQSLPRLPQLFKVSGPPAHAGVKVASATSAGLHPKPDSALTPYASQLATDASRKKLENPSQMAA